MLVENDHMPVSAPKLYVPHVVRGDAAIPVMQELQQRRSWAERLREWLFRREDLTVAGREIKNGWVIPQSLGIALIVFILSGIGTLYWRMSENIATQNKALADQEKMLIRLDQRLIDNNEHDRAKAEQLEKRLQNIDALNIAQGRDIARIEAKKGSN